MLYNPHTILKRVIIRSLITLSSVFILVNTSQAQCPPLGNFSGMSGDFKACPGMSLTYTINPVANAASYTWNLPSGATISGQNPYNTTATTVTVDYGPSFSAPGNLCVNANDTCGSSSIRENMANRTCMSMESGCNRSPRC